MHNLFNEIDLPSLLNNLADDVAKRVVQQLADSVNRKMVSRQEYASRNAISLRTVDRALNEKRLPHERVDRRVLIPADAKIQSR